MFDAYKRFFHFAGKQKGTWYKGMAFELLRSIFEALQFVALLVVLRALVEQNMTETTPWVAFGIMAVSVAGAALCWYLAHNSEGHANYRMCAEKRIHIGERMKYMPMGYFNAQSLGSLTAVATSTMEDLESMSFAVIARTVVGMIRTTIFSLAILCFDWRIGLVFLLGMILFLWVNSLLLKKSRELSPGRLAAQTRLVDAVLEYIQGMSVVRAFHGDKAANQTLNRTIEETEQQNFKLERKRIPYNVLEQIVLRVTAVAVTLLSIWFFLQGSMTLFTCLMVVVSAFLVYSELESAGEMFFMLPMIDASIDRVEEIDQAPRIDEGGSIQTPKSHDIVFDHVDFSYGDRKIIDDVSFTIPEGTTTAIVGPSGSGKTTLSKMLLGLLNQTEGEILFQGKPRDVSSHRKKKEYWRGIQAIFQDPFSSFNTFNKIDTVLLDCINMRGGKHLPKEKKIEMMTEACSFVNLKFAELTNKYPFELSGGQMQRLMIARIFLLKPKILLADEPTSMVDACSRATILDMLLQLRDEIGMTVIFITHDIGLAYYISDTVYIMEHGRFVEFGKADEVILNPKAAYTKRLISDVPKIHEEWDLSTVELK